MGRSKVRLQCEWNPAKATSNLVKHGGALSDAMTVFPDLLVCSEPDDEGKLFEERWIAMGTSRAKRLLLIFRTHAEWSADVVAIRIISARKPAKTDVRRYQSDANS